MYAHSHFVLVLPRPAECELASKVYGVEDVYGSRTQFPVLTTCSPAPCTLRSREPPCKTEHVVLYVRLALYALIEPVNSLL